MGDKLGFTFGRLFGLTSNWKASHDTQHAPIDLSARSSRSHHPTKTAIQTIDTNQSESHLALDEPKYQCEPKYRKAQYYRKKKHLLASLKQPEEQWRSTGKPVAASEPLLDSHVKSSQIQTSKPNVAHQMFVLDSEHEHEEHVEIDSNKENRMTNSRLIRIKCTSESNLNRKKWLRSHPSASWINEFQQTLQKCKHWRSESDLSLETQRYLGLEQSMVVLLNASKASHTHHNRWSNLPNSLYQFNQSAHDRLHSYQRSQAQLRANTSVSNLILDYSCKMLNVRLEPRTSQANHYGYERSTGQSNHKRPETVDDEEEDDEDEEEEEDIISKDSEDSDESRENRPILIRNNRPSISGNLNEFDTCSNNWLTSLTLRNQCQGHFETTFSHHHHSLPRPRPNHHHHHHHPHQDLSHAQLSPSSSSSSSPSHCTNLHAHHYLPPRAHQFGSHLQHNSIESILSGVPSPLSHGSGSMSVSGNQLNTPRLRFGDLCRLTSYDEDSTRDSFATYGQLSPNLSSFLTPSLSALQCLTTSGCNELSDNETSAFAHLSNQYESESRSASSRSSALLSLLSGHKLVASQQHSSTHHMYQGTNSSSVHPDPNLFAALRMRRGSATDFAPAPTSSNNVLMERRRISRPLTGRHVRNGTGASPATLALLRHMLLERRRQRESNSFLSPTEDKKSRKKRR